MASPAEVQRIVAGTAAIDSFAVVDGMIRSS